MPPTLLLKDGGTPTSAWPTSSRQNGEWDQNQTLWGPRVPKQCVGAMFWNISWGFSSIYWGPLVLPFSKLGQSGFIVLGKVCHRASVEEEVKCCLLNSKSLGPSRKWRTWYRWAKIPELWGPVIHPKAGKDSLVSRSIRELWEHIWKCLCGSSLRKRTGAQSLPRLNPGKYNSRTPNRIVGAVFTQGLGLSFWVVLKGDMVVQRGRAFNRTSFHGKNDSLSQVDGFSNSPTVSHTPAWCRVVSELLGTREECKEKEEQRQRWEHGLGSSELTAW